MDKKTNAELLTKLNTFYNQLGTRDYFSEAKFTLGVLKSLQKAEFSFVGHSDLQGQGRFISQSPSIYWGLINRNGNLEVSKFNGTPFVPFSPLIETKPKLESILADSYAKSNLPNDSFGNVVDFLPLDFSN